MAHHTSPGRGLLCSASLLASVALSLACGSDAPPPPSPPRVAITVPEGNVVGTHVKLSVSVTGCDTVQSVELLDQGERLKMLPANSGETLIELYSHEISYKRGIAARLSLTARATCANGQSSESQPAPVTFFPVESVLEGGPGVQVVPDYFIAEGRGSNVTFLGCGNESTGIPKLFRVNANGEVTQQLQMPFICNANTTITKAQPSTGIRWVWTPGAGVMAINESFEVVSQPYSQLPLTSLTVDPDGHALVLDTNGNFRRLKKDAGIVNKPEDMDLWNEHYKPGGDLIGTPIFRAELGQVLLPMYNVLFDTAEGEVSLHTLDYRTGPVNEQPVGAYSIVQVYADGTPPAASISANGQEFTLAFGTADGRTIVISCPTNGTICEGPNRRWQSEPIQGRVALLLPYAGTSRLAAIAYQHVWFLNPTNGAVLNKNGAAISPNGAFSVLQVQQGANNGHDFYLLNGTPGMSVPQPTEIVAVDRAENGELFRYQLPGGNLTAAVDDDGRLWMRMNLKLVKALPLYEYRQAQQQ